MADHPNIDVHARHRLLRRRAAAQQAGDRRPGAGRLHRAGRPVLRLRRGRARLAHPRLRARGAAGRRLPGHLGDELRRRGRARSRASTSSGTSIPSATYPTDKTVIMREFSRFADARRRAVLPGQHRRATATALLRYRELQDGEPDVLFGGRLGTYQYLDMHMAIGSALCHVEQPARRAPVALTADGARRLIRRDLLGATRSRRPMRRVHGSDCTLVVSVCRGTLHTNDPRARIRPRKDRARRSEMRRLSSESCGCSTRRPLHRACRQLRRSGAAMGTAAESLDGVGARNMAYSPERRASPSGPRRSCPWRCSATVPRLAAAAVPCRVARAPMGSIEAERPLFRAAHLRRNPPVGDDGPRSRPS